MNNYSKAADFRRMAREALSGNWLLVVLATLVASLFGASVGVDNDGISTVQIISNINNFFNRDSSVNYDYHYNGSTFDPSNQQMMAFVLGVVSLVFGLGLIMVAIAVLLGAVVSIGLCQFNLALIDGKTPEFGVLFSNFNIWSKAVWLAVRRGLYIFLWSLLLIIPGIIKLYSYSMSFFIMAENPEISPKEAMEVSARMMDGNKWRLFCLGLSFIGWDFLNLLTLGIGSLWLAPYKNAATAAFYDEISRQPVNIHE